MDFDYSEEQRMLRELCAQIAGKFNDEYWQRVDAEYRFPDEYWQVLADQGLLGVAIPEVYGGGGLGMLDMVVVAEALAEGGAGMEGAGILISGPVFGGFLLTRYGSDAQRERYLPGIVRGDIWAGAFTEPDAGSNITSVTTRATLDDDLYRINGQKMFISQMKRAHHIVVMARTTPYDPAHRTHGISLLLGDLPSPQVIAQPFKKMGSHFMDTNAVFFQDYTVPKENLVGEEGAAWGPLYDVLNPERIMLAATAVGTGTLTIRRAVQFANERAIWGKPLAAHQGLQFPLAEASVELAAARLKVYEAAWLYDQRRECGIQAAMAKYSAAHAALKAADQAIQTLGGAGYITESGVERHWRNLRLNRIAPVTDEMTLNYIAQHHLGMPRSY